MGVCLLDRNYQTNFCKFAFDSWDEDKDKLPDMKNKGKEGLSNILSCSMGSIAIGTNGDDYILNGSTNQWVKYTGNFGGGSSGGGGSSDSGGSGGSSGFIEL